MGVDQLNEKINQLELDLTATETSRGSLEDQVSMMVENIENLEGKLCCNKSEKEQIVRENNELNNSLKVLNQVKDSFETRLNSMQETLDNEKVKSLENIKKYKVELENKEN